MARKEEEREDMRKIMVSVVVGLVLSALICFSGAVKAPPPPTLNIKIHRIMQLDEIDPGTGADWYYHVGVKVGTSWSWQSSSVSDEGDDWIVDVTHQFTVSSASVFIAITLCEDDSPWSGDDLADISSDVGGGGNDYGSYISADYYIGSYGGTYNLVSNTLTGDTTQIDGVYYKTSGAFDAGTGTNDATVWFLVSDNYDPPTASFVASSLQIEEGSSISFDASSSTASTSSEIVLYQWDFDGDGIFDDSGVSVSHTFDAPGTYVVTLKIEDDLENTDTATKTITVEERSGGIFGRDGGFPTELFILLLLVIVIVAAVAVAAVASRKKKLRGQQPPQGPYQEPPYQPPPSQ